MNSVYKKSAAAVWLAALYKAELNACLVNDLRQRTRSVLCCNHL
jgi:hypothetical protein